MENDKRHHLNFFIHIPPGETDGFRSEIAHYAHILKEPVADTLYISAKNYPEFSDVKIAGLLSSIRSFASCNSFTEITAEVSAKKISVKDLDTFLGWGVNRLSLSGISSLEFSDLKKLVSEAMSRFPSVNTDISVKNFKSDKETVLKRLSDTAGLKVHHISVYGLADASEFREIAGFLEKSGYHPYDPFHFALKGKECRYLENILKYKDYIGIGPGAHGCFIVNGQKHHTENPSDEDIWAFEIEKKLLLTPLSDDDVLEEYLLQNLTLIKGMCFADFETFFDEQFGSVFDTETALAVLHEDNPVLMRTETGLACTEHTHEGVARAAFALIDSIKQQS